MSLLKWQSSCGDRSIGHFMGASGHASHIDWSKVLAPMPGTHANLYLNNVADVEFARPCTCSPTVQDSSYGNLRELWHESLRRGHATVMESTACQLNVFSSQAYAERSTWLIAGRCLCAPHGKKGLLVRN